MSEQTKKLPQFERANYWLDFALSQVSNPTEIPAISSEEDAEGLCIAYEGSALKCAFGTSDMDDIRVYGALRRIVMKSLIVKSP